MLKTNNFHINHLVECDAKQLFEFISLNSERLKYYFPVTLSSNSTLERTKEYILIKTKEIAERSNFTFAIRNKITNEVNGLIIIKKIDWDKKQGEFAYCVGSQLEGKGIASFAVKEMTKFAFENLGLEKLQIIAHKANIGSIKVALNNGFVWQRTLENEFTPTNKTPLDMELYELRNPNYDQRNRYKII
jgi:ribosomal-protein-alanine N-acetyltransferase